MTDPTPVVVPPPRPGLRVALVKPDFGVSGGFERVVDRVERALRADGHEVTRRTVDLPALPRRAFGVDVSEAAWAQAPEFFRYAAAVDAFSGEDLSRFDAVVSTQPPSFAAPHPHHLSLFFHHHRVFYDLEDLYVEAGFASDPDLHREAARRVRELDAPHLDDVAWYAAGSETVRRRLGRFNGMDRVSLFHAGLGVGRSPGDPAVRPGPEAPATPADAPARTGAVLCVGRLEFPKRTELLVAALHRLPGVAGVIVGTGGRHDWIRAVDRHLGAPGVDLDAVDERRLWCSTGLLDPDDPLGVASPTTGARSNITLAGAVDDATLSHLYATAPCVVAPAHDEDYGLTAIEAMAHGAPVIVCTDGGGLADLVTHEVDGLVVEPTGAAIATAVERVLTDRDLAAGLAEGGRRRAAATTWRRADAQLRVALALALEHEAVHA